MRLGPGDGGGSSGGGAEAAAAAGRVRPRQMSARLDAVFRAVQADGAGGGAAVGGTGGGVPAAPGANRRALVDERSWEELSEDEHGNLRGTARKGGAAGAGAAYLAAQHTPEELARAAKRARRGVIRYVVLVLDCSKAAAATDVRPSRAGATAVAAAALVREFFDANPLSHMAVLAMHDGVCVRLSELSASTDTHLAAIRAAPSPSGDASVQNALHMARTALAAVPTYGLRETLLLTSTLSTCDPGDINVEITQCVRAKVRASVVSLSAEMYVCRTLAERTKGTCGVAIDAAHFRALVLEHAKPPPALRDLVPASLICMGFPKQAQDAAATAASAAGTGSQGDGDGARVNVCPRCRTHAAELPAICATCDLTLASSLQMARSYHHLFPLPRSVLADAGSVAAGAACGACGSTFVLGGNSDRGAATTTSSSAGEVVLRRPCCGTLLCVACDQYLQTLHNCPGCLSADA